MPRGQGVALPTDTAEARQVAASLVGVWMPPPAESATPARSTPTSVQAQGEPHAAETPRAADAAALPRAATHPAHPAHPTHPTHATPAAPAAPPHADAAQQHAQGADTQRPPSPTPGLTADGKVILNTADAATLTRLPRVGGKRAQAIVVLRERLGRFRRPTDLLRVRGIGVKTLRKMLPHLVLDPPAEG